MHERLDDDGSGPQTSPAARREDLRALYEEISVGRDHAAALGLDLVRYFLDMAALDLRGSLGGADAAPPGAAPPEA